MLTEIWWFTMLDQDAPKNVIGNRLQHAGHLRSRAGV